MTGFKPASPRHLEKYLVPFQLGHMHSEQSEVSTKKNMGLFGNFSQHGGGLPNSQNPKPKRSAL